MRVYVLTFDSRPALTRAFDAVLDSPHVASCMIEAERVRLRFLAPATEAEKIVERIYLDGGLIWCSRHPMEQPPAA